MNLDPALVELADLWYDLPVLVGDEWPELRPQLLAAVQALAAAEDKEYERRARHLLRLLRPYEQIKKRLAHALTGKTIPNDRAADGETGRGTRPALRLARRAGFLPPDSDYTGPSGRWINAEVEDGDPDRPGTFVLAFDVAVAARETSAAEPLGRLGDPKAWPATLRVLLSSQDAGVETLGDTLTVPREGPSPDRARFRVTPASTGTLMLKAVFLRGNSLVHQMELNVTGQQVRARAHGQPLDTVAATADRGLSVVLRPSAGGRHYEIHVSVGSNHRGAQLRKTAQDLDSIAKEARRPLQALVEVGGPLSDDDAAAAGLRQDSYAWHTQQLAESGCRMFRDLFFNQADAQLRALGRVIQKYLTGDEQRRVQFLTDQPLLPWHLMCPMEDMADADFRQIIGLRHEVDCLPSIADASGGDTEVAIDTRPGLHVKLALNRSIDRGGERDLVRKQEAYWRGHADRGRTRLTVHDRQHDVLTILRGEDGPAGILYLYCHAVAHDPDDDGPQYARLVVEGTEGGILLRTLRDYDGVLPGLPVIVLNACRTAYVSPLSTTDFVTHFLERSRGVLGTEADTPATFAAAWATAFFERLLAGERIGEAVRATRAEFAFTHGNPLGLLYALYCNGDTALRPAITPG
ncbi:CHAT domain-containing protein [Streptomyces sp. NBC_00882]|uniref:CHAT domain-containing protein n=1 Tax=Streptomyces sp. NBC_00882 TaxID=2975856 RepID=UPI00386E98D7|nr:CHAT domain-containing protein [Streptomyces sp. NBC_00882]WSZ36932.1 CHAT domain-containing protein [Streptomyces sp. NBC_00882]